MLTRQDNYTARTVHANCTWLQTIKQIHSEALHLTFEPHTVKFTFYKYLTRNKNGKGLSQLSQLHTTESINNRNPEDKTDKGSLQLLTKTLLEQTATQFPSSWSKCLHDLTKSRQERKKLLVPARSLFKVPACTWGNKKMQQPRQRSRGIDQSKR